MSNDYLENMIEIELLGEPGAFLKIAETLTRIGIANNKEKKLYQSCHIFHKRDRYYLAHFKEMYALDSKNSTITLEDYQRRDFIARLLSEWDMVNILNPEVMSEPKLDDNGRPIPPKYTKVLAHKDKDDWDLTAKYSFGHNKAA